MYDVHVLNTTRFQFPSCSAECVYFLSILHLSITVLPCSVQRRMRLWKFADWTTRLCWSKMLSDHAVFMARYLAWRKCPARAILPSLVPGSVRHLQAHNVAIVGGPRPRGDGVLQMYVCDPDGYIVELFVWEK